jgi:hypothetical protein
MRKSRGARQWAKHGCSQDLSHLQCCWLRLIRLHVLAPNDLEKRRRGAPLFQRCREPAGDRRPTPCATAAVGACWLVLRLWQGLIGIVSRDEQIIRRQRCVNLAAFATMATAASLPSQTPEPLFIGRPRRHIGADQIARLLLPSKHLEATSPVSAHELGLTPIRRRQNRRRAILPGSAWKVSYLLSMRRPVWSS